MPPHFMKCPKCEQLYDRSFPCCPFCGWRRDQPLPTENAQDASKDYSHLQKFTHVVDPTPEVDPTPQVPGILPHFSQQIGSQKLPGNHAARGLPYTSWFNPISRNQRIIDPNNYPPHAMGTQPANQPFPQTSAMMPLDANGKLPPTQFFPANMYPSSAGTLPSQGGPGTQPIPSG
eukprot:5137676-Karenia_brevis.AAC.1